MRKTRVRFLNRELRRRGILVVKAPWNLNFIAGESQIHMTQRGWRRLKQAWTQTPRDQHFCMRTYLLRMKDQDAEKIRRMAP